MAVLISTTSGIVSIPSTLFFNELGIRPISTPISDLNLNTTYGFDDNEILNSPDFNSHITDSYITAEVNGLNISASNIGNLNTSNQYLVRVSDTDDYPGTLENKINEGDNISVSVITVGNEEKFKITGTGGSFDEQASSVAVNTSTFGGNLSASDITVQQALETIDNLTISGGASLGATWEKTSGTGDSDPGSKKFKLNNNNQSAVTYIYVSDTSEADVDMSIVLLNLDIGDEVYIQEEKVGSRHVLYELTGSAEDASNYVKLPVVSKDVGNNLRNGEKCGFILLFTGDPNDHTRLHGINSLTDHTGLGGVPQGNLVSFDSNGLFQDSGTNQSSLFDPDEDDLEEGDFLVYSSLTWRNKAQEVRIKVSSLTTGDWVASTAGYRYYGDVAHNLSSNDLFVKTYNPSTNEDIRVWDITRPDVNKTRLFVHDSSVSVRTVISDSFFGVVLGGGGGGPSGSINHNDTSNIQGGTSNEYYHLTANQESVLTNGGNADSLHTHNVGDVVGPSSVSDRNIVIFDGTTGKIIKDSGYWISAANFIQIPDVLTTPSNPGPTLGRLYKKGSGDDKLYWKAEGTGPEYDLTATSVGGGATNHNNLSGIQGGTTDEYYHLTANQESVLTNGGNADALHAHAFGSGDVAGPSASADNAIARFDGTTGKIIQEASQITINDAGDMNVENGKIVFDTEEDTDFTLRKVNDGRVDYGYEGSTSGAAIEMYHQDETDTNGGAFAGSIKMIYGGNDNPSTGYFTLLHRGTTQWLKVLEADNNRKIQLFQNGATGGNSVAINEFSDDSSLSGNSDSAVPTEKAVKAYVDNNTSAKALLQIRRSTSYGLQSSYTAMTFDTTDLESDTTVLQHNDTTTSRVDIKKDAYYEINFQGVARGNNSSETEINIKYTKNGTTDITGSEHIFYSYWEGGKTNYTPFSRAVVTELDDGDYIEVELDQDVGTGTIQSNSILIVKEL